ncbi:MAG: ATP-binding protein [Deltaproteobacteria bacterium]|nr:ATP-binding protein [Deltaproteobacteria bacterium]MBW2420492.1 ATP-binding protein [Deltaproteobacteria bacterium]
MTLPPEVWNGVMRRLRDRVPAFSYATWLEKLVANGDQDGVDLLCPTPFHRDRIRDHFLALICECVEEELGRKVPVSAELAPSGEAASETDPATVAGERSASPSQPHEKTNREGSRAGSRAAPTGSRGGAATRGARRNDTSAIGSTIDSALDAMASGPHRPASTARKNEQAAQSFASPKPAGGTDRPFTRATPRAQSVSSPTRPGAPAPGAQSVSSPTRQRSFPLSFESFVVGPCNALAREASLAIAREQQLGLHQLYLASPPGLGKTHLSRAVVLEARRMGNERSRYTTAEAFTNEFLAAVRTGQMARFKQRYRRDCNVLVLEDVQFLQGKKSTQLEFFHTVQHILDAGGRVLLTGEQLPQNLEHLDPRVQGQIAGGFVAELEAPDAAVRRNILRAKAAHGGVRLPENCLDLLVESLRGNVRELESALIQLVTTASLLKKPIDDDLTREALSKKIPGHGSAAARPDPGTIIKVVAGFFKTTPAVMSTRSRRRDILVPRQLAMYLCHRYTDASLAEIGRALGKNHPAVKNAVRRIEREVLEKAPLRYQVEALVERLDELGYTASSPNPD